MLIQLRLSKKSYVQVYFIILITLFNFYFPIIGLWFNLLFYLFFNIKQNYKKIIFFNLAFSFAILGYLYIRINETGDVYRYYLSYYRYGLSLLNGRNNIIEDLYELFYPFWYFIFYLFNKLHLSFQFINFIAGFTIYSSVFFVLYGLSKRYKNNLDKILVIKFLLIYSFVALYSSYKTLWAFSFVFLGLYFLFKNKKFISFFLFFLGIGLHPIAFFPVFIFMISKFFKFKKLFLWIALIIGLVINKILIYLLVYFINIPFLGGKVQTYILGNWSHYIWYEKGEIVKNILVFLLIIFNFILINVKEKFIIYDSFFKKYNNFIFWYFTISIVFLSFRTIELRLIYDGVIFFIPLFYQMFIKKIIYKKNIIFIFLFFIWILLVDLRLFNFNNPAYKIGEGFPYNLLYSPIIYIIKDFL